MYRTNRTVPLNDKTAADICLLVPRVLPALIGVVSSGADIDVALDADWQ
jgi:hypothetical protein